MHTADYLVIALYLGFIVGMGAFFGRNQSRKEYFAASGSMGWLAVGLSVMATLFSSNSFVFYPSAAFAGSIRIAIVLISFTLVAPVVMRVFIPVYRRSGCETAYQYLERRFHVSVRCLASGLFILLRIAWMAAATYAASLVVASVAGIDQIQVIIGLGVVSIAYTMMGGLRAVMWTDVVQFFVFAGTVYCVLSLLMSGGGAPASGGMAEGGQDAQGVGGIVGAYFDGRENTLVDFSWSMTLKYGSWALLIGVFLEGLSAFGADQVAVQRYVSAKSERVARIGFGVNLLGTWMLVPALLLIGMALYVRFDEQPEMLVPVLTEHLAGAETLPEEIRRRAGWEGDTIITKAQAEAFYAAHPGKVSDDVRLLGLEDRAFPTYVLTHFPPGLAGLFLAALMAAIMSSIDSGIHSITTAVVVDFRDRLFPRLKPDTEKGELRMIRSLVVIIGAMAVGLACFVGNLGSVFDIAKKLTAAFGGPLLAVFLLAFFSKRVTTPGVWIGIFVATGATLVGMRWKEEWFAQWWWPIGFGMALVLAQIFSLLLGKPNAGGLARFSYRGVMAGGASVEDEGAESADRLSEVLLSGEREDSGKE